MNSDRARLIEHAFPPKQASTDSVHEKDVWYGHISTLYIWPVLRLPARARGSVLIGESRVVEAWET